MNRKLHSSTRIILAASPMGAHISAFSNTTQNQATIQEFNGEKLEWPDVKKRTINNTFSVFDFILKHFSGHVYIWNLPYTIPPENACGLFEKGCLL